MMIEGGRAGLFTPTFLPSSDVYPAFLPERTQVSLVNPHTSRSDSRSSLNWKLLSSLRHAQRGRHRDMRQERSLPTFSFPHKVGDGFRAIDRGTSADREEQVNLVVKGELFGSLNVLDSYAF